MLNILYYHEVQAQTSDKNCQYNYGRATVISPKVSNKDVKLDGFVHRKLPAGRLSFSDFVNKLQSYNYFEKYDGQNHREVMPESFTYICFI